MFIVGLAGFAGAAHAQSWTPPSERERCPTKWGAGDERGAANHMGPDAVLRAARLIRTGEVIELAHVLSGSVPLGDRHFDLYMKPTRMNPQPNRRGSNEELIVAEMGQVGTQFDAFGHQTIGDGLYNCYDLNDIMTRSGFTRLGVENVGTLITRGVLIDVAALKGVDVLPDRYEITVLDLEQALKRQQQALEAGDAVLIHTGRSRAFRKQRPRDRNSSCRVARRARPDAPRRGQRTRRGHAEPRSAGISSCPSDHARRPRDPPGGAG